MQKQVELRQFSKAKKTGKLETIHNVNDGEKDKRRVFYDEFFASLDKDADDEDPEGDRRDGVQNDIDVHHDASLLKKRKRSDSDGGEEDRKSEKKYTRLNPFEKELRKANANEELKSKKEEDRVKALQVSHFHR